PPRVGARLAAAPGFLLATEGAADLRAGGPDVDVRDPAIAAGCGKKRLGGAQALREERRRKSLAHAVVHRDRLVDGVVRHHVEDRRERLALHERMRIVETGDDRRLDEEAVARDDTPA